ncbi:MAG: radical SAM protein [Desulfurococcaceae archaeon]
MQIAVIDALARARGERYATFDIVGSGPRSVAGISEEFGEVSFYPYEKATGRTSELLRADIVMISAMSSDFIALCKIVTKLRNRNFKGYIIAGGPISFEYAKLLREGTVDVVVVGEAEIPLRELLLRISRGEHGSLDSIPALAYRGPGGLVKLTSRHVHTPKEVLSSIRPWTRVDQAFEHPQIYRFYVEVVRGCSNFQRPMIRLPRTSCVECLRCKSQVLEERLECPAGILPGCGFCGVPYMFGPPRSREPRSIIKEVSDLVSHGARRIVLSAPDFLDYGRDELVKGPLTNPCYPPANVDAIEKLLNELASLEEVKGGKIAIMIENIKACLVNEDVGKILGRYLKGTTIHIGLETGCDWFNERVLGKPITVEHVIKASKILKDHGLRPYIYLMYALPAATREVYLETLKAVERLGKIPVEKITLYKYVNLPATAFEELLPDSKSHREYITRLKRLVDRYNMIAKRDLIGKGIEVFLLEEGKRTYGYPVKHGPVVFVKKTMKRRVSGCKGLVKVVSVNSRFVRGILISILECPERPRISQ